MAQPQIKTDIEARVQDIGDTMTGPLLFKNSKQATLYVDDITNYCTYLTYEDSPNISQFLIQKDNLLFSKFDGNNWNIYNIYHQGFKPTFADINFLGRNLCIAETDTVDFWANLGSGYCIIDTLEVLQNQPYQWGWLWSYVYEKSWVIQELHSANGQSIWRRYGLVGRNNNVFEGDPMWKIILDSSNQANILREFYVNITGDTMTGQLQIKPSSNWGQYVFYSASENYRAIEGDDSRLRLDCRDAKDTSNRRYIDFFSNTGKQNIKDALILVQTIEGSTTSYPILHTGNMNFYVLPLSGGTMKGEIKLSFKNCVATGSYQASATTVPDLVEEVRYSSGAMGSVSLTESYGSIPIGWYNFLYVPHRSGGFNGTVNGDNHNYGTLTLYGMTVASQHWRIRVSGGSIAETKRIWNQGDSVTSAVWNDYAECRESKIFEPGYVLAEAGDDTLVLTTERLQAFAGVSSDTWGFSQGETEKAKTPIAVAGRVLVYPAEDREIYQPGDCVCAAPNGKVSKMTRQEIIEWPDRIVGKVSCVPDYEEWGGGENADRKPVKVNGRIWIQVK